MILSDSVSIDAPPEAVFGFFDKLVRVYLDWHPDHILFSWEQGYNLRVGNVFYFQERIGGKLMKKRVMLTRVERPTLVEFAPTFWPMRVLLPRMLFRVEPQGNASMVTAEIHLRVGPLIARLNRREFDAVREHMRLEGVNMKRIVETAPALSHGATN